MSKIGIFFCGLLLSFGLSAQHLTGYYESDPQMEDYDHFKVHHYHKSLEVKAYIAGGELWRCIAEEVTGEQAEYFIENYGKGKDIYSVHFVSTLLDGLEWEFFLLGYADEKGKNRFIVVEEIFTDQSREKLLEINTFEWSHTHHHHQSGG